MLKTLRTHTKWIMIIVAVCFVGMIIFAWGMDILGTRSGQRDGIVGSVNGMDISYAVYDSYIKLQRDMAGKSQRLTYNQERNLYEEVWNTLVLRTLIDQDLKKRKVTYSDRELVDFMLNNPSQEIQQISIFMENDTFSLKKYQDFLKNPENLRDPQVAQLVNFIESDAKNRLPSMKFQKTLMDAAVVTDNHVRERWLWENEKRQVEWVFVSVNDLPTVGTPPAPEKVRSYYDEHRDKYEVGERRILASVFFPLASTQRDSAEVLDRAKNLVERARLGEDFGELANEYSEDPGNEGRDGVKRGGDLGFVSRGRFIPEFENVAFTLKPKQVSDPVLTQYGFHVITVDSIKYTANKKKEISEIKVRHILLKIEPSPDTRDAVGSIVTSFYESAKAGEDFTVIARADSLDVMYSPPFEKDAEFITGFGQPVNLLVNRTFRAKKGTILPVYTTDEGFTVMMVADVLPEGIAPFDEVQQKVTEDYTREVRVQYAEDFMRRVYARMQEGRSLTVSVAEDTVKVATVRTTDMNRDHYISGLGKKNTFAAKIFTLENPNNNTGVVVTESGCGIAVLLQKQPIDEKAFESAQANLKNQMETELRNQIIMKYLEDLKKKAKIKDNRDLYVEL